MSRVRQLGVAVAALSVGVGLAAAAGCAGSSGVRDTGTTKVASTKGSQDSNSVAGSTQLHAGEHGVLLRIKRVGRLIAKCDIHGRPSTIFSSAFLLPTASVTVETHAGVIRRTLDPREHLASPTGAGVQTWQIAPFAEANVRITTIWVSLGTSPARVSAVPCGFSAQALTTPQPL